MVVFDSDDEARAWDAFAAAWLAGRTHDAPDQIETADFADAMLLERRKRMRCDHPVMIGDIIHGRRGTCALILDHEGECKP